MNVKLGITVDDTTRMPSQARYSDPGGAREAIAQLLERRHQILHVPSVTSITYKIGPFRVHAPLARMPEQGATASAHCRPIGSGIGCEIAAA